MSAPDAPPPDDQPPGPRGEGDRQRPFPDPERSIAPRKPRTPGGVVYLVVLVGTLLGVAVVVADRWRAGLGVAGGSLVAGALCRLVLSDEAAGMLGVRRKLVDVLTLLALGAGLVVLAVVIPDQPRP